MKHHAPSPQSETTEVPCPDIAVHRGLLLERDEQDGHPAYRLYGRLDAPAAEWCCSELAPRVPGVLLLDLTDVAWAEPSALGKLVDLQREDHLHGRLLLLRLAPRQVSELGATGVVGRS